MIALSSLLMGNICRSSKTTDTILSVNLSEKQLEELHESTNLSQGEILMYHRQFLRISPTGRMTYAQFEEQLRMIGASMDASRAIFEMIDKDHSGEISFQEYLLSLVNFSHQYQPEQQLGAVFDMFQAVARKNQSNREGLQRDDIEQMLQRMHPELTKRNLEELCDRYMENDQNKNGFISKHEFIAVCMKNEKLMEKLGHKDATMKEQNNED